VIRNNKMIKIVLSAGMSVMIFGVPGFAAAGEPVFSKALYVSSPPVSMIERNPTSYRLTVNPGHNRPIEDRELSSDLLLSETLMLPPGELRQMERASAKTIGSQSQIEPVDAFNRTGANQRLLGLGWDSDAAGRNKWVVVFGLGVYISNYRDWYHPAEGFGLETPGSDRDQMDLFEKIQNTLQVVGFQIRYDF